MLQDKLKDFQIILASGSPRRQQFFKDLDLDFKIKIKPVEEKYPRELQGVEITEYLAQLKAAQFEGTLNSGDILISSDTIVWSRNRALEKPADPAQAFEMLSDLSGRTHEVITSVCFKTTERLKTVSAKTRVSFSELSGEEIRYYIDKYRPFDKAGGYGIQEWIGLIGVEYLEGSYFNVVGLPTHLVYQTLIELTD